MTIPKSGVVVNLLDSESRIVAVGITDASGKATFPDMPIGQYRVDVQLPSDHDLVVGHNENAIDDGNDSNDSIVQNGRLVTAEVIDLAKDAIDVVTVVLQDSTVPTVIVLPSVVTYSGISNINLPYSTARGAVLSNGGEAVSDFGMCWGTDPEPTINDNKISGTWNPNIANEFSAILNGLVADTVYYYRAYATNSAGIAYGEVKSFTTAVTTYTSYWSLRKCDGTDAYMSDETKVDLETFIGVFQTGDRFYGAVEGDSNYLYTWYGTSKVFDDNNPPEYLVSGLTRTTDVCP